MGTVHLRVVELEGDGQVCFKQLFAVLTPADKRIIEDTAVHSYHAVDFGVDYGGCANDHTLI